MRPLENWSACHRAETLFWLENSGAFKAAGVQVVAVGDRIATSEVRDLLRDLSFFIEQDGGTATIYDLRGLDFRGVDSSTIRRWLRTCTEFDSLLHTKAIFLVADELGFGMMRMFQLLADTDGVLPEERTHVTYSLTDAIRRLRVFRS